MEQDKYQECLKCLLEAALDKWNRKSTRSAWNAYQKLIYACFLFWTLTDISEDTQITQFESILNIISAKYRSVIC